MYEKEIVAIRGPEETAERCKMWLCVAPHKLKDLDYLLWI